MVPRRGVGRGRVRRSRGGRTPRSCRGGRHGTAPVPSSSPLDEGFWRYDFILRVRGQSANRILLPSTFSAIVSKRGLDGLLLHLQGSCRSPSYVDLELDSSRLIFLGFGWSLFDGESTTTVRAFDPSGNSMDPHGQESSSGSSESSKSPSPASSTASSSRDSSGAGGEPSSTASPSGSDEDLDVKPPVKRARQATL